MGGDGARDMRRTMCNNLTSPIDTHPTPSLISRLFEHDTSHVRGRKRRNFIPHLPNFIHFIPSSTFILPMSLKWNFNLHPVRFKSVRCSLSSFIYQFYASTRAAQCPATSEDMPYLVYNLILHLCLSINNSQSTSCV